MLRFSFIAVVFAFMGASCFAGQEYTGHYSGPMDVESHSVTRVNDGSGEMVTLEELDQTTVQNVLRQATRPDAVEMVRELTRKQGGEYVLSDAERAAAAIEKAKLEAELNAARAARTAAAEKSAREAQTAVQGIRGQRAVEKPREAVRVVGVDVQLDAPREAVRTTGKAIEKKAEEQEEGTADIVVDGPAARGMVGLQQSLDALHGNPKLIRGHGPQMPPAR